MGQTVTVERQINKQPVGFVVAMKDFFGLKDGQTLGGFAQEIRTLSEEDRNFFKGGLTQNGYIIS